MSARAAFKTSSEQFGVRIHDRDQKTKRPEQEGQTFRFGSHRVKAAVVLAHKDNQRQTAKPKSKYRTDLTPSTRFFHMGNKAAKMTLSEDELTSINDGKVYDLKKRRPGCTGMFWRQDPKRSKFLTSNADWPRDGASLRGNVVTDSKGKAWLAATHVKQASGPWKLAPDGAAMPFEYDNHYYLEESTKA